MLINYIKEENEKQKQAKQVENDQTKKKSRVEIDTSTVDSSKNRYQVLIDLANSR